MIDIPSITQTPITPAVAPLPPSSNIIGTLSPAALALPQGAVLTGVVTQRDSSGNISLSTNLGNITLNTPLALTTGSEIGFRILSSLPNLQIQLASINGTPVTKDSLASVLANLSNNPQQPVQLGSAASDPTLFRTITNPAPTAQVTAPAETEAVETLVTAPYTGSLIQGSVVAPQANLPTALVNAAISAGIIAIPPNNRQNTTPSVSSENSSDNSDETETTLPPTPSSSVASSTTASISIPVGSTALFRIVAGFLPAGAAVQAPQAASQQISSGFTVLQASPLPNQEQPVADTASPPTSAGQEPAVQSSTSGQQAALSPLPENEAPASSTAPAVNSSVLPEETVSDPTVAAPPQATVSPIPSSETPPANTPVTQTPSLPPATVPLVGANTNEADPTPVTNTTPTITPTFPGTAPQPGSPLEMNATVIGNEASGSAILKTPIGIIQLPEQAPLPKGTELVLELVGLKPASANAAASTLTSSSQDDIMNLVSSWQSLGDTLDTLDQQAPALANTVRTDSIPTTDKGFTANLLQFIDSVKNSSVSQWLGSSVINQLKSAGKQQTVDKLNADFTTLKTHYEQPSTVNHWQMLIFPLHDGEELHQIQMYVRDNPSEHQSGQDDNEDSGNATRFIVEVTMDTLGPFQFDGLVHQSSSQTSFDLVIRSNQPLTSQMRSDITNIFTNAEQLTGIKGGLSFQTTPDFPVKPLEDIMRSDKGSIVV